MDEAVRTEDVAAAQPTFSYEELEGLFRTLALPGDPHNEADRKLLVDALIAAEEASTGDQLEALHARSARTPERSAGPTLASHGRFTPIRRPRTGAVDATILDDVPSTGRGLNRAAAAFFAHRSRPGTPVVSGGIIRGAVPELKLEEGQSTANTFIYEASRALPVKRPSFVERVFEAWKGESSESTWRTVDNGVNVYLQHGSRHWHMSFVFHNTYVVLTVASDDKDPFKRRVESSRPDEFSETLLKALDGDVLSTRLALDTVQKGLTSGPLEMPS